MKQNKLKEQREAAAVLLGTGFAGDALAIGITWLFYTMTIEYVRLVAQVLVFPKI